MSPNLVDYLRARYYSFIHHQLSLKGLLTELLHLGPTLKEKLIFSIEIQGTRGTENDEKVRN